MVLTGTQFDNFIKSTDKVNKSTENKEYLDKVSQKHETVDTEKDKVANHFDQQTFLLLTLMLFNRKVLLRSADTKEAALEALLKSNSRPSSRLMVAVDFDADKVRIEGPFFITLFTELRRLMLRS